VSIDNSPPSPASTGRSWSSAYAISHSRVNPNSRTGAITSNVPSRHTASNRNWSFPFPVQPCANAVASTSSATSTIAAAITGRANAVPSGYPW
jgi:hypothetical protein